MSMDAMYVSNGKVIGDSAFFLTANHLLSNEIDRLLDFTDMLDRSPLQKKERIAEYKCAKFRYASVSLIHSTVYDNNRCRKNHNLESTHYLLQPFDVIFKTCKGYKEFCQCASKDERPDYSLYYAILAFADLEIEKLNSNLSNASDWERIELEERIKGLQFAKKCLDDAWGERKEVIACPQN